MTRSDKLIAATVFAIALMALITFSLFPRARGPEVRVQTGDKEAFRAPVTGPERTISVKGPVGTSVIEVRSGQAHMLSSDCPDKICIHMGWISRPGQVVVCLPNKVIISIEEAQ